MRILCLVVYLLGMAGITGAESISLENRRELFIDGFMIDRLQGAARQVYHNPVDREIVMVFDKPWEGNSCGYFTVFRDDDLYRMYYRAHSFKIEGKKVKSPHQQYICYAESCDGTHWTRPNLELVEFNGSKENNIVLEGVGSHNLAVFKDNNPKCDPAARYKAVGRGPRRGKEVIIDGRRWRGLIPFQSADGIHWTQLQEYGMIEDGNMDSQNLAFWDEAQGEYRAYYRCFHNNIRDIKMATSPDFFNWSKGVFLQYNRKPHAQFYTNVIKPYYRAKQIYLGFPLMYDDRGWTAALEQLPDLKQRKIKSQALFRMGTAITDTTLMSSRDGIHFDLAPDTFLPPGPERAGNWMYGTNAVAWHLVETQSNLRGADSVLSLYVSENIRLDSPHKLRRYTLRLDGFASIHAPIAGGEVITPLVTFKGKLLLVNFATSSAGALRVEIQDQNGQPIPDFALDDCVELYGDTVERAVNWKNNPDLSALAGQPVRLRFSLQDADIYSFKFD